MAEDERKQEFLQIERSAEDRPFMPWAAPTVTVIDMKRTLSGWGSLIDYGEPADTIY